MGFQSEIWKERNLGKSFFVVVLFHLTHPNLMSEKRFLTFLLSFLITLPFLQELHLLSYKEKKETRLTVVKNPKKSHFSNIWFFTQKSSKTWVWILLWATFSLWLKNETILSIFTHCEWCSSSHVIKASLTRKVLNAVLKLLRMRQRHLWTQCLKITEKVAFNIASEASYVSLKMCFRTRKLHLSHFLITAKN